MHSKPKPARLRYELTLALALKGAALFIIWAAWFSSPEERAIGDQAVAAQILSRQPAKEQAHDSIHRTR